MFSLAKLLPSACIICESFQDDLVCLACLKKLSNDALWNYECCTQCGICLTANEMEAGRCDECQAEPPHFDESYCLASYDSCLQKALHDLKYAKRISVAHGLASLWNDVLSSRLNYLEIDLALPVPLSQIKLCERGFNQSWEILRRIQIPSTIQKQMFVLQRHHAPQNLVDIGGSSRTQMIKGMFYINPHYQRLVEGRNVVIFDDVMTSKATLNEVASVLKDNGASRITNWVLLRTPRHKIKRLQHV
jgi:ComF family protein